MAAFDYSIVAELFPTRSEAKSVPSRRRHRRASPLGYGRFASAADAIRFAIEELPPELLPDACLEVHEEIFDRDGIRRLYESDQSARPTRNDPVRARQSNDSSELKETPMQFRPLHDRVVIERIDAEAKTAGGIIVRFESLADTTPSLSNV